MTQPALRRSLLLSLLDLSGETALRLQRELLLRWTQQALAADDDHGGGRFTCG